MGSYTLKNLENLTGIKADTIRIWENRYGILKPHRTLTNRRRYNDDDLRKLLNIISLYNNGYKISRIAAMNEDELSRSVMSVTDSDREVESTTGLLADTAAEQKLPRVSPVRSEKDLLHFVDKV